MSKMSVLISIIVVAVLVCPLQAQTPRGVNLAAMQTWDIVVAEDALPSEKYAAEEFQELFRQASGVKLPIVRKINRLDRHVFIGPSLAMRSSNVGFGIKDFGEEDLRIIVRDGNIAIAGGRPRGTLYGVYTFLEDYLGIRFLTYDHTHVPPVGDWRVVGPIDRFYHPPLAPFRQSAYLETDQHPVFAARMRCNTRFPDVSNPVREEARFGGLSAMRLINHSLHWWVPASKYGKTHPEYFALVDGKRNPWVGPRRGQELCHTNPQVIKIVIQGVLDYLEKHPQEVIVSVSQGDFGTYCRCDKCAAISDREESHMGPLLALVNAVADEVAKKYPKVKVGTLAYEYSTKPPKTIRPRPNVIIQLTTHDCSVTDPIRTSDYKDTVIFRRDLQGWSRIVNHINLWYYNVNHSTLLLPMPNLRVIEPNIRFFVANNIKGIFMQASYNAPGAEFSDLRNYMTSRLLWDPNQSGEALMNEFLDLHYGKAAPPIRRWLNLLHDNAEAKGIQEGWWGRAEDYGIDQSIINAGLQAFAEAMQLAENDVVRARVEKASICIHMAALEEALTWVWYAPGTYPHSGEDGPPPPEVARRTRPHFRKFFELCKKHGVTMWNEQPPCTIDHMSDFFKANFGLKPDEPW